MATSGAAVGLGGEAVKADVRAQFRTMMILATLGGTVSFIDRSVLNILAEPIKRDLGFSDTQLGLLTGFAFALFFSVMGLPIARYVDRPTADRPRVIAICLALWSAMTVISGAVVNYGQLLVARVLLAVGESGGGPAIMTLIDHYVPRDQRSRYFGIYGLGVPTGTLLGLALGGWLVDLVGWRLTFVIVGSPGLLLALCFWLFLHEPRRDAPRPTAIESDHPRLRDNIAVVLHTPALLWLIAAVSFGGLFSVGLPSWSGVYMIRVLGLTPTHAGLVLGLIMGIGGGLGTFFGGVIADRLSTRDPGRAMLVPCFGLLIGVPASMIAFQANDWRIFAGFYWVTVLGGGVYFGPVYALAQRMVKQRYRATTVVIIIMVANLIGAGVGPLLVGVASDLMHAQSGGDGLRYAMIAAHLVALLPALLYLRTRFLAAAAVARIEGE